MAVAHIPSTTSDTSLSIRIGAAPADVEGLLLHMWYRPDLTSSYTQVTSSGLRHDSRDLGEAPEGGGKGGCGKGERERQSEAEA